MVIARHFTEKVFVYDVNGIISLNITGFVHSHAQLPFCCELYFSSHYKFYMREAACRKKLTATTTVDDN